MNCKNCGAEISDYSSFCTYCGKPCGNLRTDMTQNDHPEESAPAQGVADPDLIAGREPFQQPEYGQVPDFNRSSTAWQNSRSGYIPEAAQTSYANPNGSTWREIRAANAIFTETGRSYGIAWLKFIVYVQLFAAALIHFVNAILYLSGSLYGADAELIYSFFTGLRGLDITMGVLSLLLCGATVLTRFMLTGLRRIGPWMYLGIYVVNVVLAILYPVIASALTGIPAGQLISGRDISQIISSIALIAANFTYFRHRMSAFVH
ncbi:MAG: zinc-ribbon domain-containing protein [Oscillospiraceae bacterium]